MAIWFIQLIQKLRFPELFSKSLELPIFKVTCTIYAFEIKVFPCFLQNIGGHSLFFEGPGSDVREGDYL